MFLLIAHTGYTQTAFTQGSISIDYSTLQLENSENLQLSERLLRVQLSTNISEKTNFFIIFNRHQLIVNKSNYSIHYPIGMGFSHNINIREVFCLSLASSLNYSQIVLMKDSPFIKKYKNTFNLGGAPSILYRLPILNRNLFVQTGIFFSLPLKKEIFESDNQLQILATYPFLGIGYRIKSH